jgi:hypothetical protein
MSFPFWQYFIAIESDLEKTARYVEMTEANFGTYSVEYAHILLSAASEVDVISKLLCQELEPNWSPQKINEYQECILSQYPNFHSFEVLVPRYGLKRKPWEAWERGETPMWWKSHNKVKHERSDYFTEANLENTLDAVSGLYCLVLAYHQPRGLWKATPLPKLLHVEETMLINPFM